MKIIMMHSFVRVVSCLLLVWSNMVSCSPLLPLNALPPSANFTVWPIPAQFRVIADLALPIPYPEEAFLINIVQALKVIAPNDFTGTMPLQIFQTERYPQPVIILNTPQRTPIMREFVVFGLLLSHEAIYRRQPAAFQLSHYTLLWNGADVGGIGYGNARTIQDALDRQASGGRPAPIVPVTDGLEHNVVTSYTASATDVKDQSTNDVTVDFSITSRPIPKSDLFQAIVWFLAMLARRPADTRIEGSWQWVGPPTPRGVKLVAQSLGQTPPPYLQYSTMIDVVAAAADYIVAYSVYQGLNMVIKVNGVRVGSAFLFQT